MQQGWKSAALGGAVGAVAAIAIMGGALAFHLVPVASDARLRSFLLANPKLIYEMQAKAEADAAAEEALATQKAVDKIGQKALLDPAVGYVTGPANAKNTFVEFYDYNCGHCRNTSAAVKKFYEAHKHDTRFAFIEFPIFGAQSQMAARAAVAARKQGDKALALHFALMSEGKQAVDQEVLLKAARDVGIDVMKLSADLTAPETDKAMLASARLAREAQFSGTPMFIINGKVHAGEITEDEIKALMK